MLTALEHDTLHWQCLVYDEYGTLTSCGLDKQASITEARYLLPCNERGAVIALPRCECGAHMFLKADYTHRDVWACCMEVRNDAGHTWAHVMRLGHVRNLITHWMLYERGEASVPPCIDMPPPGASIDGVPHEMFTALWFASVASKQTGHTLETTMNDYLLKSA